MTQHVVKVDRLNGRFRLSIPQQIVKLNFWRNVSHVLVEYCEPNQIILRRLFDVEDLETKDNRNPVTFD